MCRKLTLLFHFLTHDRQTLGHCCNAPYLCRNANAFSFDDEIMMITTMTLACQLNIILSNSRRHGGRTCRRGNSRTLPNVLIYVSNIFCNHKNTHTHTLKCFPIGFRILCVCLCGSDCQRTVCTVHSNVSGKRWYAFIK